MGLRHGVLVVDKPSGPTSHDIVDRVRRALGERRVGHTGTLDPFATGVLVVCVGKATRLARFLAEGEKTYAATIRFGFATVTDDLQGAPTTAPRPVHLDRAALEAGVRALTGDLDQVPPLFSAKRVQGRRLYELAREGAVAVRSPARVQVRSFEVLAVRTGEVDVHIRCSQGTYVRALARDLGEILGFGGHLVALRRLESGGFSAEDAVPGDRLGPDSWADLKPLATILPALPSVRLGAQDQEAISHGRDVMLGETVDGMPTGHPPRWWRLLDSEGDLIALAVQRSEDERSLPLNGVVLHPEVVLI